MPTISQKSTSLHPVDLYNKVTGKTQHYIASFSNYLSGCLDARIERVINKNLSDVGGKISQEEQSWFQYIASNTCYVPFVGALVSFTLYLDRHEWHHAVYSALKKGSPPTVDMKKGGEVLDLVRGDLAAIGENHMLRSLLTVGLCAMRVLSVRVTIPLLVADYVLNACYKSQTRDTDELINKLLPLDQRLTSPKSTNNLIPTLTGLLGMAKGIIPGLPGVVDQLTEWHDGADHSIFDLCKLLNRRLDAQMSDNEELKEEMEEKDSLNNQAFQENNFNKALQLANYIPGLGTLASINSYIDHHEYHHSVWSSIFEPFASNRVSSEQLKKSVPLDVSVQQEEEEKEKAGRDVLTDKNIQRLRGVKQGLAGLSNHFWGRTFLTGVAAAVSVYAIPLFSLSTLAVVTATDLFFQACFNHQTEDIDKKIAMFVFSRSYSEIKPGDLRDLNKQVNGSDSDDE